MKRTFLRTTWGVACLAACLNVAWAAPAANNADARSGGKQKQGQQQDPTRQKSSAEDGQYVDAPDAGDEDNSSTTYKIFQAVVNRNAQGLKQIFEDAAEQQSAEGKDAAEGAAAGKSQGSSADGQKKKKKGLDPDICLGRLTEDAQEQLKPDKKDFLSRIHIDKLGSLTPLALAAYQGDAACVNVLLEQGANPTRQVLEKQTPLMLACFGRNPQVANALIDAAGGLEEKQVTAKDPYGLCALHYAIIARDFNMLRTLVGHLDKNNGSAGGPIDTPNILGYTPLHYAARLGDANMFNLLIEKKADYTAYAKDGETVLMQLAACGHTRLLKDFIEKLRTDYRMRDILNDTDKRGNSALMHAVRNNREDCAMALIMEAVNMRETNNADESLLSMAASVGSTKLMLECEKQGLSPNAEDNRGRTPVIMAAIGGHSKAITELARMGADLDKYDSNGLTAYHYAKNMQNSGVMSTLAALGANTDAEPGRMGTSLKWGRVNPALMEAIEQLRVNTVRSLLNSGSSARETDFAGNTPLMVLCCPTDPEARKKVKDKPAKMAKIMDMLLKQKPDVNAVNAAGQTALMRAAADLAKYDENSGMVYELLKAGAYVNDRHGFTRASALCYAGYEAPDLNEKMVERWAWRLMAVGARVRDIQTNGMDAYYISADVESKKKADQKKKEAREKAEKGEETDGEEAGVESTEARSGLQGDINKIKRTNRRDADKKAKDTREKAEGQVPSSTKDLIDGQEDKLNQLIGGDGEEGDGASSSGAQEGQEKEHATDRVSREVEIGRKDDEEPQPDYKDHIMPGLCLYFGSDMRQRVITADGRGSGSMALRNEITTKARQWLVNFAGQGILSTLGVGPGDNANRQQGNNRQQGGNNNRGGMNRGGNGGNAGGNRGGNRGGGMNGGGNRGGNGGNRGGNRGR